jgi:hypothetical protein
MTVASAAARVKVFTQAGPNNAGYCRNSVSFFLVLRLMVI